jgi:hypothetical protein
MSGAEDDDEYLEPAPFILMEAGETFDGQERWFTRAAYDLQVRAVAHSAVCGHPGYIPDDYLEHLNGLGIETTIPAAELCAIGTWERISDGYRCLDWEGVEYALDGLRQSKGEDAKALAEERDHEARAWAHMATPMVVTPPCAACASPAAASRSCLLDSCPLDGISGQVLRPAGSSGAPTPASGTSCATASPERTATAVPCRPPSPGRSPGHSGFLCATPRSTLPGSTTT